LLGTQEHLDLAGASPAVIMLVGLQGSGKTTASTKLASFLRQQGMSPLLVAANPYRPATSDQLVTLGRQLAIPVYAEPPIVKPIVICQQAHHYAREHGHDVAILDTAQRQCIDDAILDEAAAIGAALQVQEVLLIVDAMTGQESVRVAEEFNARLPLSGLILTRMDGDGKGGAVLSIRAVTDVPIKFISTGETVHAFEPFDPGNMAMRILGLGDSSRS
jgi:signal recognition particle subunit SRP54